MIKTLVIICGLGVIATLYFADPVGAAWLPKCPFWQLTGWQCPACGLQRAIHSLLHGDVCAAWHYNMFLCLSVPYAAMVAYTTFSHGRLAERLRRIVQHRIAVNVYIACFVAWWVVRNIYQV